MYVVPRVPTANIPIPEMALRVKAPPLGICSDTTPSSVGQKKVLRKPYKVAAIKIMVPAAKESVYRPTMASAALTAKRPNGDSLWTIGPAKNRKTIMMAEVYTKIQPG